MKRQSNQSHEERERSSRRRRWLWLLVAALIGLGVGGYVLGRHLWAMHHWRQSQRALDDGDHERALASLEHCLDYWPDDAQTHASAARAQRLAGRSAEAAKHLKTARDIGGDLPEVALQAQLLDAATGKLEPVESTLRRHVDAGHAEKRQILDVLIRAYLARGRADEAERYATLWIDQSPDDWQPWFLRALARTQRSHDLLSTAFDQAKKDYERALERKPDFAPARLLLGNAYMMHGQFADALPHLEQYCRLKTDDPNGVAELARCLRGLARVEEARRILDDWLADHPGTLVVFQIRGQVAMDLARPEEALDWFQRAEKLGPSAEKTQFQLAQALRALGRAEEAQAYEEKWRTRAELTTRLSELEKAAAKEPGNVTVRHEAGVIALRLGRDAAGLRWLAAALQLDPNHRATHQVLADHFQQRGNAEAAAFHRRLAEKMP